MPDPSRFLQHREGRDGRQVPYSLIPAVTVSELRNTGQTGLTVCTLRKYLQECQLNSTISCVHSLPQCLKIRVVFERVEWLIFDLHTIRFQVLLVVCYALWNDTIGRNAGLKRAG
jgi:hypothetical protein